MATITDTIPENQLVPVAFDDRTAGGIPLPHPNNSAKRDAVRMRAALILVEKLIDASLDEGSVRAIVAELIDAAPDTLNTLNELAAALGDDPNFAATIAGQIGAKANAANAALTGVPTAPTASVATDTTQIATTAFVRALLASGAAQGFAWNVPTASIDDNDTTPASTAFVLAQAANADLLRALASATRFVTPKAMADAMAFNTFSMGAWFDLQLTAGFNLFVTLTANSNVNTIIGGVSGEPVVLYFQQDGTGGRTISFTSTYHKFPGGSVPTLSTAANAVDRLTGICRNRGGTFVVEWSGIEKDIR